jgi:arylformamidase
MVTFPGDPPFSVKPFFERKKGDTFDLSLMTMGTHIGTHVDPPAHYLEGGSTVDELDLDILTGPGLVLDMRPLKSIDAGAIQHRLPKGVQRVLFKTDNSSLLLQEHFHEDFVHLTEDGAGLLVERGVRLVGIDYLSIERYNNIGAPVHKRLLRAGIVILEGVNLLHIEEGAYEICCLPLAIRGADGAPARVILRN